MTYNCLELDERGPVLWVTLNRPQALNALNLELVDELGRLFTGLYVREDIRVVVMRGAGRAFCAGLDLTEHAAQTTTLSVSEGLASTRRYRDIVIAMRRCPQPIIGLLNGPACGGGFALALATDVRIATPTLRLNAAFIRIGFSACDMGLSYFLPRMVGSSAAAEYMLTGRFIDARRACELGLVSRVVEPEQLDGEANALIEDMLRTAPLGLRLTKEVLGHAIDGPSLEAVIAMEDRNQTLCAHGEDFREAMTAFIEKRPPRYGTAK
ncbi:enoyl-CoA hydratase/isomerase family protein [Pseudomonas saliphila]|uniref:enoyl-CoA hydratase/isomerase family protein n=1 Tax=Pseudomonas saliphila TaxID=2586906 RepID=UPI001238ED19|nr:enoyl-CoA hydratase-related protein [Pseudomonas saliphila]